MLNSLKKVLITLFQDTPTGKFLSAGNNDFAFHQHLNNSILTAILISVLPVALIFLSGCSSDSSAISAEVRINGQSIYLAEVAADSDTLIGRRAEDDTDFDMEYLIFQPLLQNDEMPSAKIGENIGIKITGDYDSAVLYDHLLDSGGRSIFNRNITETALESDSVITLSHHIGESLSSDSSFVESEHIRGFRIVIFKDDVPTEYAFTVYVSP